MSRVFRSAYGVLLLLGIDPRVTVRSLRGLPAYRRDLRILRDQQASAKTTMPFGTKRPCLGEGTTDSGLARGHYFHQDLLVAHRVFLSKPERHVDIGSRVDGFVAHVASFRPIEIIDIRPLEATVPNITTIQADMMAPVGEELVDYCDSLSCLHALEHFGLGRYGDRIDFDGHLLGLANLERILKPGGVLYLSVPMGQQRIEFNAHRVFSVAYMLECLADAYRLDRFSYVDDAGDLHEDVEMSSESLRDDFGCRYGCGIFELTKR